MEEASAAEAGVKTLAQTLRECRKLGERYTPSEVIVLYQKAIDEVRASGTLDQALRAGLRAPGFVLPDENGKPVSSHNLLASGALVLCFFRGRWCPYDIAQLEAMAEIRPEIQVAGASLVAISPQTVHQCFLMQDQYKFAFPLLCDEGNQLARQFGLVYKVPEYQQRLYRRSFVNLPFANGDESWELPAPATYVLGKDGTIRFARVDVDYRQRPEPLEVLRVV